MQKRISAVIIGLLMMPALMAQNIHKAFEKALDYINCKAVKLSIEKKGEDTFSCNCNNKPDYSTIVAAIPIKLTTTKQLAAEINKIKNDSEKVNEDNFQSFLTNKIFTDNRGKTVSGFKTQRSNEGSFEQFQNEISTQVAISLLNFKISKLEDTIKRIQPSTQGPQMGFIAWQINPLSIAFGLALVILLYYLVIRPNLNDKFDKGDKELNERMKTRKSEISNLQNLVNRLDQKLSRYAKEPSPPRVVVPEPEPVLSTVPTQIYTIENVEKPSERNNIQYASVPESDGYFIAHNLSGQFKPAASIYKIIKQNDQCATFEFEDREEALLLAIAYPNNSITPVCEELNAYNAKAKRIVTQTPGKLELRGDKWTVIEKAKIKYE